jgi:hypothetical protein
VQQLACERFQTGGSGGFERGLEKFGRRRAQSRFRLIVRLEKQVSSRGQCQRM